MNPSEALTFKGVTVSSPDGLSSPTPGEVVVQPGIGVVVFVHGDPRFVLRQEDGIDVFLGGGARGKDDTSGPSSASSSSTSTRDVSVICGTGVIKISFMTEGNAKSFKQTIDRSRGDTSAMLRASINAEAGMARAVTAMEAAARDDDYGRQSLASELNRRRQTHRELATRFNSGQDAEALLLRERFSTAAERSRQRLDQVETRHIERLESALLANQSLLGGAAGTGVTSNSNADRQRLWDAWGEAEAYRDSDMRKVGAANTRDNHYSGAGWQAQQKKRQQLFDSIQQQLREIDHVEPALYGASANNGNNTDSAALLSPQSQKLVSQVKSLLGEHQHAVHDARDAGAARAEAEIADLRAKEADFIRQEQDRKAAEQAAIAAELDRQLAEQREALARMKAQAEEEDRRRKQLMEEAKNTVRMHGDWKEMRGQQPGQPNFFVNVLTGRTTTDVNETPWKEPPRVHVPDPVLARVEVPSSPKPAAAAAAVTPVPEMVKPKPVTPATPAASAFGGPKPGDTNGDWKCHKHDGTGKLYFVNKKENKTTWKVAETPWGATAATAPSTPAVVSGSSSSPTAPPKAGDTIGDWKCHHHAGSDKLYFVNKTENKTTWKIAETPWASAAAPKPAAAAAASPSSPAAPPKPGDELQGWKCHHHAASDKQYYVNKAENKTTWKIAETPWANAGAAAATPAASPASPASVAGSPTAPPKAGDTLGDWKCHRHAASDKLYFVNKAENKTTWKIAETPWANAGGGAPAAAAAAPENPKKADPQPGDVRGDWKCHKHEASGKLYFANKKLNKTVWKAAETDGAF